MQKILIANRGEIARRVIRAARGLGIRTAVVHSDADADALFVREADESVRLEGTAAADTYLMANLIIEAAQQVGADAVHPGYGFLSENADFAEACVAAGLTFIGPPPAAIRSMGDKVTSKEIMAASGVPTLQGVTVTDGEGQDLRAALADIGLPAIVKASAGGGGRGMRVVNTADELLGAVESAQREAKAAFGDGTVFIERYLAPSRHIEVQIVADDHGQVAALFERECSIQRRHQKVVEEAPSPVVDEAWRARLMDAAVKAARAVDYRGAGTVEFIAGNDGTFAFLEMNTRLQVEHPVTECITGLDLVALQIAVARGEALPAEALNPTIDGHAIEVRLCAEDPAAGYLPVSGTFEVFEVGGEGIRVDTGVESGSVVSPYYDSMVAKVIAHGPTRRIAADRLADALTRARLHGLTTNRDLLVRILRSPEYLAGDTTTDFLQRVSGLTEPLTSELTHRHNAVAAALAIAAARAADRDVQAGLPIGWRNNRATLESVELKGEGDPIKVAYHLQNPTTPTVEVNDEPVSIELHPTGSDEIDLTIGGVRRCYRVQLLGKAGGDGVLVDSVNGSSSFVLVDPLPAPGANGPAGGLIAPMPGAIVRVLVAEGDTVAAGTPLLVMEAMKMEHTITSPADGVVRSINVAQGTQVERGAVLVEMAEEAS
ncbi:biotin carboxylase N-terminal domain-containing protein [Sporichthya brevicatena]|uniref:Biotin carboxylase N-terminal domain-containing protein n=1 Tax=Sporichthya brevicatena TaxID=171442 RepID=A0ABN1H623_9ACTN